MTHHKPGWAAIILVLLLVFMSAPLAARGEDRKVVTAVVLRDLPPLFRSDGDKKPTGFAVAILDEIAARLNWTLHYHLVDSWGEAAAAIRDGRADLLPGAASTLDWEREFLFTEPIVTMPVSCFVRSDQVRIDRCDHPARYSVAVLQSGAAHRILATQRGSRLLPVATLEAAIGAVLGGEVNMLIAPEASVLGTMARLDKRDALKIVGRPWMEARRAIMLSRGQAETKAALDDAILEFLRTPRYRQLLQHHYPASRHATIAWHAVALTLAGAAALGVLLAFFYNKLRLPASMLQIKSRFFYHRITPWFFLILTLSATLVMWRITHQSGEKRAQERIAYRAEEERQAIDRRMLEYEQVLRGYAALFDASHQVDRAMWRTYTEHLRIETYWPGIQGIGFSLVFTPDEKEAHVRHIRSEGFPGYVVHPEGAREQYSSVIYLEPFKGSNLHAFGYDMLTESVRRAALEQARDSGEAAVSGKVKLIQETTADAQPGFLMFVPVYRPGLPTSTVPERRQALLGFVYSPFRVKDLMLGILGHGIPDLDFDLFDGNDPTPDHLLYSSLSLSERALREHVSRYKVDHTINLPGRIWTVRFAGGPAFEEEMSNQQPMLVPITGLLMSILLFGILRALAKRQEDIEREAGRIRLELHQTEARYQRMVDNIKEVIFQTDAAGTWQFLNPAWEEISGYTIVDSLGRNFIHYVHPDDQARAMVRFLALMRGELPWFREELCGLHRSGALVWVEVFSSPQIEENGKIIGTFGTLRDISSRRKADLATRMAREAAELASQAKSNFLATMSHEIRTPMNAILGMADLLWESELNPEQRRFVQVFRSAGENLLNIINDILDFSKIEAGQLTLERILFDPAEEINVVCDILTPQAKGKGLALVRQINPGIPRSVEGDPTRLRQILLNLLGNAIKFTHRGTIRLAAERVDPTTEAGLVPIVFRVEDTGVGISGERLGTIFDSFTQADASITRRYGGTGLGLAIVKKLVEKMNGRVHVESQPGNGTRFAITIPFAVGPRAEDPRAPDLRGKRLLVVSDIQADQEMLRNHLDAMGGRVEEATNLATARQKLHSAQSVGAPFDLVLLDEHMLERKDDQPCVTPWGLPGIELPTLLIVAEHRQRHPGQCDQPDQKCCLVKPINRSDLHQAIHQIFRPTINQNNTPNDSGTTGTGADNSKQILLVDDSEDNRLLIKIYLANTSYRLQCAESGMVGLDMLKKTRFDLVLMDVQMPDMDGYTATKAWRQFEENEGLPRLPVIALTANALREDVISSLQAGCDAHVVKPIKKRTLLDVIQRYLHEPHAMAAISGSLDGHEVG
ncbi:MAG: CHASE domain-containing protein [Magnetococcales bacterium]|nr:CHASE domain-containing protein [Magnetococcales bacterium]